MANSSSIGGRTGRVAPAAGAEVANAGQSSAAVGARRVIPVDVLRGLVLLVLLPDLAGGFSFYRVAQAQPEHWLWAALAAQFRHVDWSGVALWDLVMPLFVFVIGVSMALSMQRREQLGRDRASLIVQAALRSATLLVLGVALQFKAMTIVDELLPYIVVATGLPVGSWIRRQSARATAAELTMAGVACRVAVLALAMAWMGTHIEQLGDYQFGNQILVLVGLAYAPAVLLHTAGRRIQWWAMAAIVGGYGLAFIAYTPPPSLQPVGPAWSGLFSHWNNGTNLADAFDLWLFGALPRSAPYTGNPHGYHTLQFVPLIAVMLAGAQAGRALARLGPSRTLAWRFVGVSLVGLVVSGLLTTLFPLIKTLWTPSWTVFSTALCLLALAAVMAVVGQSPQSRLTTALVALGSNSILLYVLAFTARWRIVGAWDRIVGHDLVSALTWWPVAESVLVLLTLWCLGYILFRLRILVKI